MALGSPPSPEELHPPPVEAEQTAAINNSDDNGPSQTVIQLWTDTAAGIDRNQTVVWRNAVDTLDSAVKFLPLGSEDARRFVEGHMQKCVSILLDQQPSKIGQMEKNCVEESLKHAVTCVAMDLQWKNEASAAESAPPTECIILDALAQILNRKRTYYKGSKPNWNMTLSGAPEVRVHMIQKFRSLEGWTHFAVYLEKRAEHHVEQFPNPDILHQLLGSLCDIVPVPPPPAKGPLSPQQEAVLAANYQRERATEDVILRVCNAIMRYMMRISEDSALKKQVHDVMSKVLYDLKSIYDRLPSSRRTETFQFYIFWRDLTLKLITSTSLPVRLYGWDQVNDLIEASRELRPPPKYFKVGSAGRDFVNGKYEYGGPLDELGYATHGGEPSYIRMAEGDPEAKKITLFRCTMRSQQKWWFLSEADEVQPGTDKDIDYYQHKSRPNEDVSVPPASGWLTCRNAGEEPPPILRSEGLMVPAGEEYNTLEHQLAKWSIENKVIELVLGDSVHREVVARSQALIKFLANMCERDQVPIEVTGNDGKEPNKFCLQASHLLLAWRTCASKADAAVSTEVYTLLVSILPSLPDALAIQLLGAIQTSLRNGADHDKHDLLPEVAEFCIALAKAVPDDNNSGGATTGISVSNDVRREVLHLLWGVLTHPEAHSVKAYDQLKQYVTRELQVEPNGALHRKDFLKACTKHLAANAVPGQLDIDEAVTLQKMKLTRFVLEACPIDQAASLVTENDAELPLLLFNEVCAYLVRKNAITNPAAVKRMGTNINGAESKLSLRLGFLRYAYGLSGTVFMSSEQLDRLWALCLSPSDRENLMEFLADASGDEAAGPSPDAGAQVSDAGAAHHSYSGQTNNRTPGLSSAFSSQVREYAFQKLVCATDVSWEILGMTAYRSFQTLFNDLRRENRAASSISGSDIDALWRICLTSGDEMVASESMRDLLFVFANAAPEQATAWSKSASDGHRPGTLTKAASSRLSDTEEIFIKRIFECLLQVRQGLEAGDPSSDRAAERSLRILNSAVGQEDVKAGSSDSRMSHPSTIPVMDMSAVNSATEALGCVPHGLRGQSSYLTISVVGKRTSQTPHSNMGTEPHDEAVHAPAVKLPSTVRFPLNVHPLETLLSVKAKVAEHSNHHVGRVKAISINGRQAKNMPEGGLSTNLNVVPESSTISQLGVTDGCEIMFLLAGQPLPTNNNSQSKKAQSKRRACLDLAKMFAEDDEHEEKDHYFDTLLSVLEALPMSQDESMSDGTPPIKVDSSRLVWDLLLAMPSNPGIVDRVRALALSKAALSPGPTNPEDSDTMAVDVPQHNEEWGLLLDGSCLHRSVYTMQVVDSFLQPAPEILCSIGDATTKIRLGTEMSKEAKAFRKGFVSTGGFDAFLRLFTQGSNQKDAGQRRRTRRGDAVALRVLKCCFFGSAAGNAVVDDGLPELDESGTALLENLNKDVSRNMLRRLAEVVVSDSAVFDSTVIDALAMVRLLLKHQQADDETIYFVELPDKLSERFVTSLLLRQNKAAMAVASASSAARVRKSAQELVLSGLQYHALPWLAEALKEISVESDNTEEFFSVLRELVEGSKGMDSDMLTNLGTATCEKIAAQPQKTNAAVVIDSVTGVLCGCLQLLHAIIDTCGGSALVGGAPLLLKAAGSSSWAKRADVLDDDDAALIDIMGALFDGYLSSTENPSLAPPCCDKVSRQLGFEAVASAAKACHSQAGYFALVQRITDIVDFAAPFLRHRWAVNASETENSRNQSNVSKYSGLRNQGCTCYMNSFLQQLFMMSDLRKKICSAPLPSPLRSVGGSVVAKGSDLVGKLISVQWATGLSYEATVKAYDDVSGMHTIQYCPLPLQPMANRPNTHQQQQIQMHQQRIQEEVQSAPLDLPEEFILAEGRPGKESGVFDIVTASEGLATAENAGDATTDGALVSAGESEEQAAARRLLEEIQRTFVHLEEGTRGRCFDPRTLVEASGVLKLEFDVWQQNDASEYAMKLLDRLEVPLKRYAPKHFKYLESSFGLKQTKQKLCKECGLKTNREENLMNIDCQIRAKTDIHEALETMCEVEYMEGDNKVFCDRCKKKCDTILRTAISALPDMLVLSLKRFDLDFNTFETVKLNSRLAFGHTLNMKKYTLEGVEALDNAKSNGKERTSAADGDEAMEDAPDPLAALPDENYEYKLVGVLVHAGVAQGGHYYSYIKDRTPTEVGDAENWYRFDDEDVTPFDPANIETECFGGKLKKEAKWPNGQVHLVESEQFANALMLFYEKVDRVQGSGNYDEGGSDCAMEDDQSPIDVSSGYDVFQTDVRRSNTTHGWHEFLADSEFQIFLKNLLALCGGTNDNGEDDDMDVSPVVHLTQDAAQGAWRLAVVQLALKYVFDVLLHSNDKISITDWESRLCNVFDVDIEAARWLVRELVVRSESISKNWLRTFCLDCPEESSRVAANKIIIDAMLKCVVCDKEATLLQSWTTGWKSQMESFEKSFGVGQNRPFPVSLEGDLAGLERCDAIEDGSASAVGKVISLLVQFTEYCPRNWRNSVEMFYLLRELSCDSELLRNALAAAQIPARLVCLAVRENSPAVLKAAFPGAVISQDAATLMVRAEGSTSHMMLPQGIGGGSNLQAPKITERFEIDFLHVFEALACSMGLSFLRKELILDEKIGAKGRVLSLLSDKARKAFEIIFDESKSQAVNGMGQQEINIYMETCGIDPRNHVAQKIIQKLGKYNSISYREGHKDVRYLTLNGFLDYYRDTALANETQARNDLCTFGFRPNLTRRPLKARIVKGTDHILMETPESIATDVAHELSQITAMQTLGPLAELGLNNYHLYFPPGHHHTPHNKEIILVLQHILSATAYEKDTTTLLVESLEVLSQAPTGANAGEIPQTCLMIFKVLLSIPDSKQQLRMATTMLSAHRSTPYAEAGVGIMTASKELSLRRTGPHLSNDFHAAAAVERYIEIVKILYQMKPVADWMKQNREHWAWMEQPRDRERVRDTHTRDGGRPNQPVNANHPQYSDSDMNQGFGNESEEDDEEFRFEQNENIVSIVHCDKISVNCAGVDAINGEYQNTGTVDFVPKFTKTGMLDGKEESFALYRCQLLDRSRKWFISIVPRGAMPGTNKDIDFYWAACNVGDAHGAQLPPRIGWQAVKDNGKMPVPVVEATVVVPDVEEPSGGGQNTSVVWNEADESLEVENGRDAGAM